MLTREDLDTLRAPFAPAEIEFLRGYAYVREYAVNTRLSEVDPSWMMQITAWEYRSEAHVVVMGSMTLKDVTRYGVGEQLNEPSKDRQTGAVNPPKVLDCAKGAATDLLKRLARLFFVGAYLTELPDNVKTIEAYTAWYWAQNGATSPKNGVSDKPASIPSQTAQNAPKNTDDGATDYEAQALNWFAANGVSIVEVMRRLSIKKGALPPANDKDGWRKILSDYAALVKAANS